MTITQKIRRDLLTESSYTPNGTMITCSNQFMRRNFRLYIDGSYKGEAHYTENCQFIRKNREHPKRLRSFVISQFCDLLVADYRCSISTALRGVVSAFTPEDLELLNTELIDDALDLIADEMVDV